MDDEISYSVKLAVEIIITAVLIFAIALFAYYSNTAYNKTTSDKYAQQNLQLDDALYYYNNKNVQPSDIMDCILSNVRRYNFEICCNSKTSLIAISREGNQGIKFWAKDNIIHTIETDLGISWNTILKECQDRSLQAQAQLLWSKNNDINTASVFNNKDQVKAETDGYQVIGVRFTLGE